MEVESSFSSKAAVVSMDEARMTQVLRNLFNNALRYTGSGGRIAVRAEDGSGQLRIEVHDSGPGLSPDQRRSILSESPYAFHCDELVATQGSGMGMFLARRLAEMHGGVLGVDLDWEGEVRQCGILESSMTAFRGRSSSSPCRWTSLRSDEARLFLRSRTWRSLLPDERSGF